MTARVWGWLGQALTRAENESPDSERPGGVGQALGRRLVPAWLTVRLRVADSQRLPTPGTPEMGSCEIPGAGAVLAVAFRSHCRLHPIS